METDHYLSIWLSRETSFHVIFTSPLSLLSFRWFEGVLTFTQHSPHSHHHFPLLHFCSFCRQTWGGSWTARPSRFRSAVPLPLGCLSVPVQLCKAWILSDVNLNVEREKNHLVTIRPKALSSLGHFRTVLKSVLDLLTVHLQNTSSQNSLIKIGAVWCVFES